MSETQPDFDALFKGELNNDEIILWSEDSFEKQGFDYLTYVLPNIILVGAFFLLYRRETQGMNFEIFSMISFVTLCGTICATLAVWISQRIKPGLKTTWALTNFRKIGVIGDDKKAYVYTYLMDTAVIKIASKKKGSEIRFIDQENKELDITYSSKSVKFIEGILSEHFLSTKVLTS